MTRESPEALFQRHAALAYFFGRRWLRSFPSWMHEDVLAEARVGLWKACRTYDPARGVTFSTWAGRCITNHLANFHRSYHRHEVPATSLDASTGEDADGSPYPMLAQRIAVEERMFAEVEDRLFIQALPPTLRLIAAGLSQEQTGRVIGRSRAVVRKRMRREWEQVRQWFERRKAG